MEIVAAPKMKFNRMLLQKSGKEKVPVWPEGHTARHSLDLRIADMQPGPRGEGDTPEVISQHSEITNRERKNNTTGIPCALLAEPISLPQKQIGFVC